MAKDQDIRAVLGNAIVNIESALDFLNAGPAPEAAGAGASPIPPSPTPPTELPADTESYDIPTGPSGPRIIPWGAKVSPEFLASCLWIEEQLGLKVEHLMPCMMFESGLNPKAKNPQSTATGLIQFMEATARRLGTTTALLAQMSGTRQLTYVYKYFKEYKDRGFKLHEWSLEDTYMAILWPAGIGKDMDFRVFTGGTNAYKVNAGLDLDKDGFITKREATEKIRKLAAEGTHPDNAGFL